MLREDKYIKVIYSYVGLSSIWDNRLIKSPERQRPTHRLLPKVKSGGKGFIMYVRAKIINT